MESYRIRQARPEDMDAILHIEQESFDPAIREDRGTFQERLEVFPRGFVLLVGPGGEAGYLCSELWDLAGTPGPSDFALGHSARDRHTPNGRTLYISSYGILERFRGKGLGRSLFRGFLDYARETVPHEEIILLVSETWTGARSIYADEGFSRVLVIPAFFRFFDGEKADGIVMRRRRSPRTAPQAVKETL